MTQFGASQPIRRVEDHRLVSGGGRYTDDIDLPNQLHGVVVRSPYAHARITSIDIGEARALPGVVDILTAADLDKSDANLLPCMIPLKNRDGSNRADPKRPVLARDIVRHVGEAVAFVVAENRHAARDAAELVMVDYDELDATVGAARSIEPGAVQLHPEAPGNVSFDWSAGDEAALEAAFARAAHVTRIELVNNRLVVNSMEPRCLNADWDAAAEKMTVYAPTQGGWGLKNFLAGSLLKIDPSRVRVITPDVGGAFGMKLFYYSEAACTAFAARKLARPVKWVNERTESFLSDSQGRDHVTVAELALDGDHRALGLRVRTLADLGAYHSSFGPLIPSMATAKVLTGAYRIPALHFNVKGVFTNTVPVDAYRGAGRPEAIYMMERLIDKAGRETGIGPVEIRRRNFVSPEEMPYTNGAGEVYDSGEFRRLFDACLEKADYAGFPARKAASAKQGKRRGFGISYFIEATGGNPTEGADVRFETDGTVSLLVGTQSGGQGHATAYTQIMAEKLGLPHDRIRVIEGDTDRIPSGGGTGGSRSLTTQGAAILNAGDRIIEKGRLYAGQVLETALDDIEFDNQSGEFSIVGTDRRIGILELAARAREIGAVDGHEETGDNGLDTRGSHTVPVFTFPNGCHVCEVEIDEATGTVAVVSYAMVDDFGTILNPQIVEGQVIGGVAQGIGQALLEHTVYDENGQLLSGSLMDYCLARADNLPPFDFSTIEVPCKTNPLGVKGVGEAGTIAGPPAVMNAVFDALAELGVERIDMPATAEVVWQAMQAARAAA
ncbi:xanthine dehydrogenase family protein molybdopterin-binding subunit [Oceanibacterium hippocampi]|uniref:Carbon monoxide dehydrogenase large chain n=1 Tax=Oceanibacterium hippocampi TaxID=745714 RepID=A0A1Y5RYK5_9PROT|nr:xanthine dehydrogenase family protein molybdopterin-binding subunit [Oceanibacterium hippocampi]SLN28643.1 Carbon monoxide dehydrogenase large chain [Oceanibacterium hippocampi]